MILCGRWTGDATVTIKTQINGQPFEIEVDDGVTLEFGDGKLSIKAKPTYTQLPSPPYPNWYPIYPNPLYPVCDPEPMRITYTTTSCVYRNS